MIAEPGIEINVTTYFHKKEQLKVMVTAINFRNNICPLLISKESINIRLLVSFDIIELEVNKSKTKKSYFGALKGIGPFNKEDKWDTHE